MMLCAGMSRPEAHQLAGVDATRVVEVQAVEGALQVLPALVNICAELRVLHSPCRQPPCDAEAATVHELAVL